MALIYSLVARKMQQQVQLKLASQEEFQRLYARQRADLMYRVLAVEVIAILIFIAFLAFVYVKFAQSAMQPRNAFAGLW